MSDMLIDRGATFLRVYRPATEPTQYLAVAAIVSKVPLRLTVTSHGLLDGWEASLIGYSAVSKTKLYPITVVDPNTIEFNDLADPDFPALPAAGMFVAASMPLSLAGMTGRLEVRASKADTPAEVGSVTISDPQKSVTVEIPQTVTAAMNRGLFEVLLISGDTIAVLDQGKVTVDI